MSALKPVVTTTLSTKGQLILPKAVRDSRGRKPGDRLSVEETPDGLLLRRDEKPAFPPTRMEDVFGVLKYEGPPVSLDEVKRGVGESAAERYLRSVQRDEG